MDHMRSDLADYPVVVALPYHTAICNHGCARYGRTRNFDVGVVITNKSAETKSFSGPLFHASSLATINSDKHLCSSIGRRMMLPLLLAAISLSPLAEGSPGRPS